MPLAERIGRPLRRLVRLSCARPALTVAIAVVLAIVSLAYALTTLTFATSTRSLLPPGQPYVERFTQYLTLVGLTALLVGGVGVANAIRGHLDRKRDTIATMKTLGATGGSVFTVYLTQTMALAFIGAIPGLIPGATLPFLVAWGFGSIIPLPLAPTLHLEDLALALLYGLLTALAFAIWTLGRVTLTPRT